MIEYFEARVLFDYIPATSDELHLRAGESIEVRVDADLDNGEDGWLSGSDVRGKHGMFPSNYVMDLRRTHANRRDSNISSHTLAPDHDSTDATSDAAVWTRATENRVEKPPDHGSTTPPSPETVVPSDQCAAVLNDKRTQNGVQHDTSTRVIASNPDHGLPSEVTTTVGETSNTSQDRNASDNTAHDLLGSAILLPETQHTPRRDMAPGHDADTPLPHGWHSATDEGSGIVYYYTEDGQSTWMKPVPEGSFTHESDEAPDKLSHTQDTKSSHALGVDTETRDGVTRLHDAAATRIQAVHRGTYLRQINANSRTHTEGAAQGLTVDRRRQMLAHDEEKQVATRAGHKSNAHDTDASGYGRQAREVSRQGTLEKVSESSSPSKTETTSKALGFDLDSRIAWLVASAVDERVMEEFRRRDIILSDIQATVKALVKDPAGVGSVKGNCLISPQRLRKKLPLPATPRVKAHIKSNGRMYGKGDSRGADGSPSPLHELSARLTERGSPGRDHSSIDPQLVARLDSRPDPGAALGTQRRPRPDGHYINGDSSRSALAALARAERSPPPPLRSQPLLALAPCSTSSRENLESDGDVDGDCSNGGVSLTSRNHETPECAVFQSEMAGTTATAVARTIPKVIMSAPRVADVEGVHQRALEKQRIRAAEAAALVRLSPRGRTTLYHPTWYNQELADTSAPDSELVLEYVHGYAGDISRERTGGRARGFGGGGGKASGGRVDGGQHDGAVGVDDNRDQPTGSPNVLWLRTGEIVFPTSAIVVIHHVGQNRQRFFTGHDEEVTALAVHPSGGIVASGQTGREAVMCIFDASRRQGGGTRGRESEYDSDPAAMDGLGTPLFLRELSFGRREGNGVAALDFSSDGELMVAMSKGDGQALSVWDWRRGVRLATARLGTSLISTNIVRFNPWLSIGWHRQEWDTKNGSVPYNSACYTLVSCGRGHVKFWTLTGEHASGSDQNRSLGLGRGRLAAIGNGDSAHGRGLGCGGGSDDEHEPASTGNVGRNNRCLWRLSGKRGAFGGRGDVENMTCMTFIGEPCVRVGGKDGGTDKPTRRWRGRQDADIEIARLPLARVVTGAENGQIYFWEVVEERQRMQSNSDGVARASAREAAEADGAEQIGWKPEGRLLAVVPGAHHGALTGMCYMPHGKDTQRASVVPSSSPLASSGTQDSRKFKDWGRLATCGGEGTLRLWAVTGEGPSPLRLLLAVEISSRGVGIGYARSVSWNRLGTTVALGTVGNAVCLVRPGQDAGRIGAGQELVPNGQERLEDVMFMLTVQGHAGPCKALASHPARQWFVTGGADRILRLWDTRSRLQLSAVRMMEKVCSAAFHPAGDVLAVGNEVGDFFLMVLKIPPSEHHTRHPDHTAGDSVADGFSWEVLARKKITFTAISANSTSERLEFRSSPKSTRVKESSGRMQPTLSITEAGRNEDETGVNWAGTGSPGAYRVDRDGRRPRFTGRGSGLGGGRLSRVHASRQFITRDAASPNPTRDSLSPYDSPPRASAARGIPVTAAKTGTTSMITTAEVSVLRFSPDGSVLGAACGIFVHLYRERARTMVAESGGGDSGGKGVYRRYGVCTGHSTKVRSFDFSRDGAVMQSNDSYGELLFWEVSTGRQITNSFSVRDVEMDSWSCPVGWPIQGLAAGPAGVAKGAGHHGAGAVMACRSHRGDVMVTSDDDGCVRLARNPAPEGAVTQASWGHVSASGVSGLAFLHDDRRLISTGGTSVFVWRHVRHDYRTNRQMGGDLTMSGNKSRRACR